MCAGAGVEVADGLRHEGRAGRSTCPSLFRGMEVCGEPVDRGKAGAGRLLREPFRPGWIAGRSRGHWIHGLPAYFGWDGRVGVALVESSFAPSIPRVGWRSLDCGALASSVASYARRWVGWRRASIVFGGHCCGAGWRLEDDQGGGGLGE